MAFVLNALKNARNVLIPKTNVPNVQKKEFLELNLSVHAQNINSKRTENAIIVQRNARNVNLRRFASTVLLKQEMDILVNAYLDSLKQETFIAPHVIQNA